MTTFDIRVEGISEINTNRSYTYMVFADNIFDAFKKAVEHADDEYTCKYDEDLKPIPGTTYKEFVSITKVENVSR